MSGKSELILKVKAALENYNVYSGNGVDIETFKKSNAMKSPAALVTFDGFDNTEHFESNETAFQMSRYTITLINEKGDIEEDIRALHEYLEDNTLVTIGSYTYHLLVKSAIAYDSYKDEAAELYLEISGVRC